MGNKNNLLRGNPPTQFTNDGSGQNAVDMAMRSAEVRRQNRKRKMLMKDCLHELMNSPLSDNIKKLMSKNGMHVNAETINIEAIAYSMFLNALKGNHKMIELIMRYTGQDQPDVNQEVLARLDMVANALKGVGSVGNEQEGVGNGDQSKSEH